MTIFECKVSFEGQTCIIFLNGIRMAEDSLHGLHYYLNAAPLPLKQHAAFDGDLSFFHEQLGRVHVRAIQNMVRNQAWYEMKATCTEPIQNCEACIFAKSNRAAVPKKIEKNFFKALLQVHSDVCSVPEESIKVSRCSVTSIEDYFKYC